MSVYDLYGIKEVADVTFWDTVTGAPVLYLDTLKVSTIEETAEQTEARGGKGNAPLIIWDYGKEITLTLEDALFSMKSMAIMHGVNEIKTNDNTVVKTSKFTTGAAPITQSAPTEECEPTEECTPVLPSFDGSILVPAWVNDLAGVNVEYYNVDIDPSAPIDASNLQYNTTYIAKWVQNVTAGPKETISISSENFPGTYKITGDTYARNQATGKDEFFQFIVPLAKVNPEQTITMQADGDPSTFSMTVRVLRPADGIMMQLVKYPM